MRRGVTGAIGAWLAGAAVLFAAPGCGLGSGSGCSDTVITVEPVATEDMDEALVFTAHLSADDQPIEGAELEFYVFNTGPDGELQNGTVQGTAVTDADGIAELVIEGGSRSLSAFEDEVVTSYKAKYRSKDLIDGERYCAETSDMASIDVPCAGFGCLEW